MLIIKNALSNINCSKGRNILIGIIVLVITASSCVALSVKQAAKHAESEGIKDLSITASIVFDREKVMKEALANGEDFRTLIQNVKNLSIEEMEDYAYSQYVQDFHYSASATINGNELFEAVSEDNTANNATGSNGGMSTFPGGFGGTSFTMAQGDFTIVGYSSYGAMSDFVSGNSKIVEGEIFDLDAQSYDCVISSELAAYNNLHIGDSITLANPNDETQMFEYTITGLYEYSSVDGEGFNTRFSTAMDPANQIYTSYEALQKTIAYTEENATLTTDERGNELTTAIGVTDSGTFVLGSMEAYDGFVEDVRTMGLSENYTVSSTDLNNYESSLIPIQNTAKFADLLLWIILGVGGIILFVLNVFNVRERKYEVGVLMAIGMKKWKVATQFVCELVIVAFVAILLGTGLGAVASVPVSDSLLASQIDAQENKVTQQSANFGRPGQQLSGVGSMQLSRPGQTQGDIDYVDTLDATTNLTVIMQLMGIGLVLSVLASLSAVVFVMRYEPLKILSDRT